MNAWFLLRAVGALTGQVAGLLAGRWIAGRLGIFLPLPVVAAAAAGGMATYLMVTRKR